MKDILHTPSEAERAHLEITRVVAETESLDVAAPQIIRILGEIFDWEMGILWLVDRKSQLLRFEQSWSQPAYSAAAYLEDSRARTYAAGDGLPGRVWRSGQSDTAAGDSDLADAAARAIAFPVTLGGQVLGVLELITHSLREPSAEFL